MAAAVVVEVLTPPLNNVKLTPFMKKVKQFTVDVEKVNQALTTV